MLAAGPWIALAALGAFHGLNPAMGWLFAVALGSYARRRRVVLVSLVPIALGHLVSVAVIAASYVAFSLVAPSELVRRTAGLLLIGWGAYYALYGHRHRVRFGMRTGAAGLAAWSFLMASMHGAGLMLIPALMTLCAASAGAGASLTPIVAAGLGVFVHTAAMLLVMGVVAIAVYDVLGLLILRSAWINVDLIWTLALVATGCILLAGW